MSLSDPIADMLTRIRNAVRINKEKVNDKFNYQIIKYSLGDSVFKFKYNPYSRSIEQTEYQVNSLEELSAFLLELRNNGH